MPEVLRIGDPHVSQTLSLPDELAGPSGPAFFSEALGARILKRRPPGRQEAKSRNFTRFAQPSCKQTSYPDSPHLPVLACDANTGTETIVFLEQKNAIGTAAAVQRMLDAAVFDGS
jgi:hypothetical protein